MSSTKISTEKKLRKIPTVIWGQKIDTWTMSTGHDIYLDWFQTSFGNGLNPSRPLNKLFGKRQIIEGTKPEISKKRVHGPEIAKNGQKSKSDKPNAQLKSSKRRFTKPGPLLSMRLGNGKQDFESAGQFLKKSWSGWGSWFGHKTRLKLTIIRPKSRLMKPTKAQKSVTVSSQKVLPIKLRTKWNSYQNRKG